MSRSLKLSAMLLQPRVGADRQVGQALHGVERGPAAEAVADDHEVVERTRLPTPGRSGAAIAPSVSSGSSLQLRETTQQIDWVDRDQDRLALLPGIGQGIGRHVVDEAAHRLVDRRPAQHVVLLLVEREQVLVGLGDRRPGQLVEQQVALVALVGEPGHVDLAQLLVRELRVAR